MAIGDDFTIDYVNKRIHHSANQNVYTVQELYSWLMDMFDEQGAMDDEIPMSAQTPTAYTMINGWKIKLYDGNYQFTFIGTLITDDESARTVPPDSGNVEMVFQVSSQGTVVGDIQELQDQCEEIETQLGEVQTQTENIEHVSEGRWEIKTEGGIDYLIQYESDNPDVIHKKYQLVKKGGIYVERIPV